MPLKVLNRDGNSITYANPTDPNYQVRIKTTSSKKALRGNPVDNYVTEVIINDDNAVQLPNVTGLVEDALSVRIRVSGTVYSQERIMAVVNNVLPLLPTWGSEGVFVGFEPTTPPEPLA